MEVRHNGNQRIQWFTDSLQRMQLWNTRYGTINGFTNVGQNGYLGISNQPLFFQDFFNSAGPFSRLHLADSCNNNQNDYAQVFGWRPWMKNGVSMTGNKDQCYLGQKYDGVTTANDSSDIVLQWSDNPDDSPWPSDRLRFLFTNTYQSTKAYGAHSKEGLESFRIFVPNDTDAFVGIGDFYRARYFNSGVMVDPTERLDVLDGRVRIRQLPTDPQADDSIKVLVIDTAAGPDYGVVKWKYASAFGGGAAADCDWLVDAGGLDVTTAWDPGATAGCPDDTWNVGIGTDNPTWKLQIAGDGSAVAGLGGGIYSSIVGAGPGTTAQGIRSFVTQPNGLSSSGWALRGEYYNPGTYGHGLYSSVVVDRSDVSASRTFGAEAISSASDGVVTEGHGVYAWVGSSGTGQIYQAVGVKAETTTTSSDRFNTAYGVWARARGARLSSYGTYGLADDTDMTDVKIGATGVASGAYDNSAGARIGVYGNAARATRSYAGYFHGDVAASGSITSGVTFTWSDQSLKQNVSPITGAAALLQQIEPVTYDFDTQGFTSLGLPDGMQSGVLAQNVQAVLPHLVNTAYLPALYDSLGNETAPALDLLTVNYDGLVPYLLSAIQEQQTTIDAMQQQLTSCCADDGTRMQQGNGIGYIDNALQPAAQASTALAKDDLVVIPNPFQENPTISYRIGTTGRAQLRVSSSEGRDMGLLFDAGMQAGQHTLVWNTTGMAVGTYWLTLTLDGVRITEQAVKVQ